MSDEQLDETEAGFHELEAEHLPPPVPKPNYSPGDVLRITDVEPYSLKLTNLSYRPSLNSWYVSGYRAGKRGEFVTVPADLVTGKAGRWQQFPRIPFRDFASNFNVPKTQVTTWVIADTKSKEIVDFAKRMAEAFLWEQWEACQRRGEPLPRMREITVARTKVVGRVCVACRRARRELQQMVG